MLDLVVPRRADTFADSVGVTFTVTTPAADAEIIRAALAELGVRHARAFAATPGSAGFDFIVAAAGQDAGLHLVTDPRFDGVLDSVEISDGTSPTATNDTSPDSDRDGLSDDYEINVSHTDPTRADTDGDGLSDAEEVFPLQDRYITNPLDADTDDDGILDGNEHGINAGAGSTAFTGGVGTRRPASSAALSAS